jgi:hypothetical protein
MHSRCNSLDLRTERDHWARKTGRAEVAKDPHAGKGKTHKGRGHQRDVRAEELCHGYARTVRRVSSFMTSPASQALGSMTEVSTSRGPKP